MIHSDIFISGKVPENLSHADILYLANMGWGSCMAGEVPPHFGKVMTELGKQIGVVLSPQNVTRLSDEWIATHSKEESV